MGQRLLTPTPPITPLPPSPTNSLTHQSPIVACLSTRAETKNHRGPCGDQLALQMDYYYPIMSRLNSPCSISAERSNRVYLIAAPNPSFSPPLCLCRRRGVCPTQHPPLLLILPLISPNIYYYYTTDNKLELLFIIIISINIIVLLCGTPSNRYALSLRVSICSGVGGVQ